MKFYLITNECECCNRNDARFIGVCFTGRRFIAYAETLGVNNHVRLWDINSYNEFIDLLSTPDSRIEDEFGKIYLLCDIVDMISNHSTGRVYADDVDDVSSYGDLDVLYYN